jgi:hypothetical protein
MARKLTIAFALCAALSVPAAALARNGGSHAGFNGGFPGGGLNGWALGRPGGFGHGFGPGLGLYGFGRVGAGGFGSAFPYWDDDVYDALFDPFVNGVGDYPGYGYYYNPRYYGRGLYYR